MHGTKEGSQKSSNSWLDLCNNGDYSMPPTGLEFHNTQLLPNSPSQCSAAVSVPNSLQCLKPPGYKNWQDRKRWWNVLTTKVGSSVPLNKFSAIGSQDSRSYKRHSYSGNSSTHYYTGSHYSQLAAAASSIDKYLAIASYAASNMK